MQSLCNDFVTKAIAVYPELNRKPKVHLLLHLAECLNDFGPTSGFSAERYHTDQKLCTLYYVIPLIGWRATMDYFAVSIFMATNKLLAVMLPQEWQWSNTHGSSVLVVFLQMAQGNLLWKLTRWQRLILILLQMWRWSGPALPEPISTALF